MSATAVLIWFLIGILVSIVVGNKLKVNIGLIAMTFGFILCVFGMGMSTSEFIALFPAKTLFTIMMITYFFGYANDNGTLASFSLNAVYKFRKIPALIPVVFFLVAGIVCFTGASPYAPSAVLIPIIIPLCLATGLSPLLGCLIVNLGGIAGAMVPWGQGASVQRGVLETSVYAEEAEQIINSAFGANMIYAVLAAAIVFFVFKGYKAKVDESILKKPDPMNSKQKITLLLIALLLVCMMVPSMLGNMGVVAMKTFSRKMDIGLVCAFFACLCALLRLGDDKTVVAKHIPWNTILMLGGVTMLVGAAEKGGAVAMIGGWMGSNVPVALLIPLMVLIAGFMSVFVAGATVVTPTLFAIVPSIAASAAGVSYYGLYHAAYIGACATSISPFSGGGSLTLASVQDATIREKMFLKLIIAAGLQVLLAAVLGGIGLFG